MALVGRELFCAIHTFKGEWQALFKSSTTIVEERAAAASARKVVEEMLGELADDRQTR